MANAKTLRKRIALVAATALGVGMLATTPANAASTNNSADVSSISLATVTAAPAAGVAVKVNVGAAVVNENGNGLITDFTGYLSSYPTGGFAQVSSSVTLGDGVTAGGYLSTSGRTSDSSTTGTTVTSVTGGILRATGGTNNLFFGSPTITASSTAGVSTSGFGSYSFTPAVAGTYVLTVFNDANNNGLAGPGEAVQTISITVGASSTYSAGYSTAYIAAGGVTAPTSSTNVLPVSASMTLNTQAADVLVTLNNSAQAAMNGETLSATIAGPGLLGITTGNTTYNTPSTGRALSSTLTDNIGNISVWSDGTAGVATVTISVTDATSGATTVLATKTVTFYGAVASLKVISQNYSVAKVGGAVSGINTGLTATSDTPAVTVAALDANGNVVPGVTVTGLSSNTSVIASSAILEDTTGNDAASVYGGPGYYNATVTPSTLATSGQSATVTYQYTANLGVTYISAPAVTFTIGGTTPATVTFGLDSATYAPGAKAVLTVTAKDSAGNPVADNTYATFLAAAATSNAAVQGTLPAASVTTRKGVATYTLYAPVNPVAFTITGTLGASVAAAAQGTAVSAAATVTATADPAVAAAKAAADAASAAVTALSTTVASLFASISYQVRVLNVLIKRIMSKLRIK